MPIRVHNLAKELGVTSKDVMQQALNHGIEVANHMASLQDHEADIIRAFMQTAPPSEEEKRREEEKKAREEQAVVEEAKRKMAAARAVAARKKAETDTDAGGLSESDAAAYAAFTGTETPGEMTMVSPPDLSGAAARAREAAADAERFDRPQHRTDAPVENTRIMPVSASDISRSVVNRREEPPVETGGEVEAEAGDDASSEPREMRLVAPQSGDTVVSRARNTFAEKEPTVELPQRRGANIVGHRELPTAPRRPAPRARGRAPGAPGPSGPGDAPGMIQTDSQGSRRTFVRAPQRGGGGPGRGGPFRGGPGGARGPGGPGGRRGGQAGPPQQHRKQQQMVEPKDCEIQLPINIKSLSAEMGVKSGVIIERLLKNHGLFLSINSVLDKDTIETIALEFDCDIKIVDEKNLEREFVTEEVESFESDPAHFEPRPPIVAFLGHVDHGKTSLLDHIRKTRVAEREAGGITQHIGAYRVATKSGDVVFLDTPGHRAFTEMRARGAHVTDVVVLVVAADDGVKPQTEEAINHARAAGTPIIVALNKMDKPEANPMQVKQQLAGLGLQAEDWGGDTIFVEVSALTGKGVDSLLEYLALYTELLELRADPTRPAVGTVIESLQKKGEGNVARVMITDGSLERGDNYICGHVIGKVKAIRLPDGKAAKKVGPAWPVEITGLPELPAAGEKFFVVKDLVKARELAEERQRQIRETRMAGKGVSGLENLLKKASTAEVNIILKVDTVGSLEVLRSAIAELQHAEVEPKIIHSAVGGITDTDVTLADASEAVILGFHVTDSASARRLAEEKGVEIRLYSVIYELLDELKEALEGKLAPERREVITGHLEVLKTFRVSRVGVIAGSIVQDGLVRSTARARVTRDGIVVFEGKLASLRHHKDDVKEIKEGQECGVRLEGFDDVKVGDVIEPYEVEEIKRTLA